MKSDNMRPEEIVEVAMRSERVRGLNAVCIQAAVRRHFGRTISDSDAADLALVHTSSSLISDLRETIDLHIGSSDEHAQFGHMIYEAKLGRGNLEEKIRARREFTESTFGIGRTAAQADEIKLHLIALAHEATRWRRDYGEFLDAVSKIYKTRKRQLGALKLPDESLFKATVMLDAAVSDAIWQSQQ